MTGNTQKLSIRLVRDGLAPENTLRDGVDLEAWSQIEGAKASLGTMGGGPPKWARFLDLTEEEKAKLRNNTAFGVVFVPAEGRWFAVTFGMGHVKLDPAKFEQDFGLRVVLNAVDPKQLKSADVRTPDENTLSRRSQTSRGSDQTAFAIDIERDIVRGLAGKPKNAAFASRVAGTDALSMDRKMEIAELSKVCAEAYEVYQKTDYKADFGWIDQIRHIRDHELIAKLDAKLVEKLNEAVSGTVVDGLHLAFPVIYDPERASQLRYKGFRSWNFYPDLDLAGYIDALHERGKAGYTFDDLNSHSVHEVDDDGKDRGDKWSIRDCIVFEAVLDGHTYVLSGGRWYQIDADFSQGTVSARVLIVDGPSRDKTRDEMMTAEGESGQTGYCSLLPKSTEEFRPSEFTVVYAVLATGSVAKLPFFSLVSFRQAARELQALGYKYGFAWVEKMAGKSTKKKKTSAALATPAELEGAAA